MTLENKIYQQNIFGGEDEVLTRIPVYVWRNKETGKYFNGLCDVSELHNAAVYHEKDYSQMSDEKKERFFNKIEKEETLNDKKRKFLETFEFVELFLTITEFNEIMARLGGKPYRGVTV